MAAGSGTRMGSDTPKQFLELGGRMILRRTIETIVSACPGVTVITVLPEQHIGFWKDYCYRTNMICPQILVKGGITRFHSVRNALERIPDGAVVAVHDGVRPLISTKLVEEMFDKARMVPALIPVVPCVDTIKVLRKSKTAVEVLETVPGAEVDRSMLYGAQTPQIFHSEVLKQAYMLPYETSFTDDASVVERYGKNLSYTMGERFNIKITTVDDLTLAEAIMRLSEN